MNDGSSFMVIMCSTHLQVTTDLKSVQAASRTMLSAIEADIAKVKGGLKSLSTQLSQAEKKGETTVKERLSKCLSNLKDSSDTMVTLHDSVKDKFRNLVGSSSLRLCELI